MGRTIARRLIISRHFARLARSYKTQVGDEEKEERRENRRRRIYHYSISSTDRQSKMEIVGTQRTRTNPLNDVVSALPLYRSAPPLEVRLEDFELFAMDRLRGT